MLICVKEVYSGAFALGSPSTGSTQKQSGVLDRPVWGACAFWTRGFLTGFASLPVLASLERVRAQRQLAAVVTRLHQAPVSVHVHVHVHVHRRGSIY